MKRRTAQVLIERWEHGRFEAINDLVAIEEPLEIRLVYGGSAIRAQKSISITMRTPGNDFELAAGFLFTESIVEHFEQIQKMTRCAKNVVKVDLHPEVSLDFKRLERHFYTSSSCGVCGKTSLEALEVNCVPIAASDFRVHGNVVVGLSDTLRANQNIFSGTGGIHGTGLFTGGGSVICTKEDVGRHNAVDKVIGEQMLLGKVPLDKSILMVSGRTSFEILQKALRARIPILVAVGAPSSLAIELAQKFNLTLIGFLREGRFNIYSARERIV